MLTLAIIGAGNRGATYAGYALEHPDQARVTAVAEPRAHHRAVLAALHQAEHAVADWRELLRRPKVADAVVIAAPDRFHADMAEGFAAAGYHILLEKPMATNEADCRRIVQAVEDAGVLMAVCHVYRYTAYTQRVVELVQSGVIGEVVNVQHFEPVGYWHQAHSFVRGNWGREDTSSFMLMTKSCHDLDWLQYVIGQPPAQVSSFGGLYHFKRSEEPNGAADRCLDCTVERRCPYSAIKIYLEPVAAGATDWPYTVLTPEPTIETMEVALREGPYGRCVYRCDNDVVDHQVVNLQYAGGSTASFTMTAFNRAGGRKTRIHGTRGDLYVDVRKSDTLIQRFDFMTDTYIDEWVEDEPDTALKGHHCGDYRMMERVVDAFTRGDEDAILTGPQETLRSHLTVFAAERARQEGRIVAGF
ncbi:MAG: Gfo/Idh/MocA family oxidoreductase [Bacteroidota bacterium]